MAILDMCPQSGAVDSKEQRRRLDCGSVFVITVYRTLLRFVGARRVRGWQATVQLAGRKRTIPAASLCPLFEWRSRRASAFERLGALGLGLSNACLWSTVSDGVLKCDRLAGSGK